MSDDDVKRLLAEATPGPWDNTFYCKRDGSPIETIEDIREIVAGSVDYSARTELFGVSLQDADDDGLCTVICYTGNGPNAHNNAALIAAAPTIAAAYIEQCERVRVLETVISLIEVDLTAGDMPGKTRIALALDRARAALKGTSHE